MSNRYLEREVKFKLNNFEELEKILQLLRKQGQEIVSWFFEKNLVLDDFKGSLQKKGVLLRLRQDKKARITLKLPVQNSSSEFKEKWELEVEVSDFVSMQDIFKELGFRVSFSYEKFRTIWKIQEVLVCLDILPFGFFLELEGKNLKTVAKNLGFSWENAIIDNYFTLSKKSKEQRLVFNSQEKAFFQQKIFDF